MNNLVFVMRYNFIECLSQIQQKTDAKYSYCKQIKNKKINLELYFKNDVC